MKKYLLYAVLGILSVAAGSSFLGTGSIGLDARDAYLYSVAADTITNTENDTITIPAKFKTNYQINVSVVRTSLSGTHNVKLYLDESNLLTGTTDWRVIDSTSTTSATVATIRQSVLYGLRYRVRVSGTGSQSSRYKLDFTGKPI